MGETPAYPDPGFAIYVHWPFCKAKCPYCDFNSHVREEINQERWRAALLREIEHFAAQTQGREVTSVFFGGGTPSLMPPETVAAVIEAIRTSWPSAQDPEITLEANPTSSEAEKFEAFAAAGVNRLSVGVQSLENTALRFLGRQHSAEEALEAVALARAHFKRFSFDMIYARPGQSAEDWAAELRRALAEGPEHISLYQLTIEENTVFEGRYRRGELTMPSEGRTAALFEATQRTLEEEGLPAYEISNHAKVGAECRHNLTYWRYGDYVGVGPGAHGRLLLDGERYALRQHRAPEAWLAQVEEQGHATRGRQLLTVEDQLEEMTLMGLRLREGIAERRYQDLTGKGIEELFASKVEILQRGGLITQEQGLLRASAEGRQRLDALLGYLLAGQ